MIRNKYRNNNKKNHEGRAAVLLAAALVSASVLPVSAAAEEQGESFAMEMSAVSETSDPAELADSSVSDSSWAEDDWTAGFTEEVIAMIINGELLLGDDGVLYTADLLWWVDPYTGEFFEVPQPTAEPEPAEEPAAEEPETTVTPLPSEEPADVQEVPEPRETTAEPSVQPDPDAAPAEETEAESIAEEEETDDSDIVDPEDEPAELEGIPEEGSNEDLLASVQIVHAPEIREDFRFRTIDEIPFWAVGSCFIYEDPNTDSRHVGALPRHGVCYLIESMGDGWYYVESGNVRGYILTEKLTMDAPVFDAELPEETAAEETGTTDEIPEGGPLVLRLNGKAPEESGDIQEDASSVTEYEDIASTLFSVDGYPLAVAYIEPWENAANADYHVTVQQTVVGKDYALAEAGGVLVMEEPSDGARAVGGLPEGGLCCILADRDREWVYVESGDVRGFVRRGSLNIPDSPYDVTMAGYVLSMGEENFAAAEEYIAPEANGALYYTFTSVREYSEMNYIRESMMEFASQFIGNPYVWGGNSLTNGCDCSGFVREIYHVYGYELPRVAEAQAYVGMQIPVEEAQPGDLIFYAQNGYIYHVVMSTGNGGTIEAMSASHGIVYSYVNDGAAVWACRILED